MLRQLQTAQGVLELSPKRFGFLRNVDRNYCAQQSDAFVPVPLIQKYRLQEGMLVSGPIERQGNPNGPRLIEVTALEGMEPAQYRRRSFDELTPIDPHEWIRLET